MTAQQPVHFYSDFIAIGLSFFKYRHCEGIPSTALREISLLKDLNHPNIINLIDVIYAANRLYLAFEYLDTDLRQFIDWSSGHFPHSLIKVHPFVLLLNIFVCLQIHPYSKNFLSPVHNVLLLFFLLVPISMNKQVIKNEIASWLVQAKAKVHYERDNYMPILFM